MIVSSAYLKLKMFLLPMVTLPFHPLVAFRIIQLRYMLKRIGLSMQLCLTCLVTRKLSVSSPFTLTSAEFFHITSWSVKWDDVALSFRQEPAISSSNSPNQRFCYTQWETYILWCWILLIFQWSVVFLIFAL